MTLTRCLSITVFIGLRVIETLKPLHHGKVTVSTERKNSDLPSGIHYPGEDRAVKIYNPQVYTTQESTGLVKSITLRYTLPRRAQGW